MAYRGFSFETIDRPSQGSQPDAVRVDVTRGRVHVGVPHGAIPCKRIVLPRPIRRSPSWSGSTLSGDATNLRVCNAADVSTAQSVRPARRDLNRQKPRRTWGGL